MDVRSRSSGVSNKERLASYLNHKMRISCDDGRYFTGMFKCVDNSKNVILSETEETREGSTRYVGMIMVPGNRIQRVLVENLETDIMTVTLAVTESYKSLILAGLPPLVIMDICSRALAFWSYQASQELMFQHAAAEALREKILQTESRASTAINKANEKLKVVESKLSSVQSALHAERQERSLAEDSVEEKSRQLRGLKLAYENIRQKHALARPTSYNETLSERMPTLMRNFDQRRRQTAFRINDQCMPGLSESERQGQDCLAWQTKQSRVFPAAQSSYNSPSWSF
ncbi:hypothetical protein FB645_003864 [Coemansia sp. IMI 203386]|nr:hypothetical protein FB645_003864 [Coemansia sp. IMI 203386]